MRVRTRTLLLVVGGMVLVVVAGAVAFLGPLRDTDLGHQLRGEIVRADAASVCKDEIKQRVPAFGPTSFGPISAEFRDGEPSSWNVSGTIERGEVSGPWSCTVEWGKGGAWVMVTSLSGPGVVERD